MLPRPAIPRAGSSFLCQSQLPTAVFCAVSGSGPRTDQFFFAARVPRRTRMRSRRRAAPQPHRGCCAAVAPPPPPQLGVPLGAAPWRQRQRGVPHAAGGGAGGGGRGAARRCPCPCYSCAGALCLLVGGGACRWGEGRVLLPPGERCVCLLCFLCVLCVRCAAHHVCRNSPMPHMRYLGPPRAQQLHLDAANPLRQKYTDLEVNTVVDHDKCCSKDLNKIAGHYTIRTCTQEA